MSHNGKRLCYIVTANITYKKETLLIFHKEYKTWLPVGGHIEKEEDPESALYREIKEETGLTSRDLVPISLSDITEDLFTDTKGESLLSPLYTDIHNAGHNRMHVAMRYFFESKRKKVVSLDPDIKRVHWFTEEDLNGNDYTFLKHVKFYAQKALELSQK